MDAGPEDEGFIKPSRHFSVPYSLDMLPFPSVDFSLRSLVNCFFRGLARTELCPHMQLVPRPNIDR